MTTADGFAEVATYRIRDGLMRYRSGNAYVIEGGPVGIALQGTGAVEVLPEFCDLLESGRTVRELSGLLKIPVGDVVGTLSVLRKAGLLQQLPADPLPDDLPDSMRTFVSRSVGFTGRFGSAAEAVRDMGHWRVLVGGAKKLADNIRETLESSWVSTEAYSAERLAKLFGATDAPHRKVLVIEAFEAGGFTPSESLVLSHRYGAFWLGGGSSGNRGFVGPISHRDFSCSACLQSARTDRAAAEPSAETAIPLGLVAGLAAGEAVHLMTGVGRNRSVNQTVDLVWDPAAGGLSSGTTRMYRRWTCATCGAPESGADQQRPWAYEQDIALPPRGIPRPAVSRLTALGGPKKVKRSLPTCASVSRADLAGADGLRTMGTLLDRVVGLRPAAGDGTARRRAPSAGNLESAQACVLSREEIPGIHSHAAWFQPDDDRFVAAGRVSRAELRAVFQSLGVPPDIDHVIAWVANLHSLTRKYGDLALRLAHLDAGVVFTHALLLGRALGIQPRLLRHWNADSISTALDLEPEMELVTGIMVV
ncbi:nitroreductase family protein [Streptomyces sp. HP-A2021]|uniref:nitroreductase family protein n=1 Tax=Streptomyces sp. HP-A2021 TaxID=2927875 RepID=UPI001FAF148E|nr:nitroreductase family protein [Streptomyces sp. HP-A2021]UOB12710.1 nitroreductase family protein [Streptomyces sp. HP-A2021]